MSSAESKIVSKLIALAPSMAQSVDEEFAPLLAARDRLREELTASGEIAAFEAKPATPVHSMCAIDGARIREQMYAVDLLYAVAAGKDARFTEVQLPVESLVWADIMRHMDGTELLVQTAMASLEVAVAASAPHQIVALDGSFLTPMIGLQSGLFAKQPAVRDAAADILLGEHQPIAAVRKLLDKPASSLVALTKSDSSVKYTQILGERFGMRLNIADRVLATQMLRPGEMLAPRVLTELASQNVNEVKGSAKAKRAGFELAQASSMMSNIARDGRAVTTYFKPYGAHTVIRFEFFSDSADSSKIMEQAKVYASILNSDTKAPHMLEPFCQYAVDREVKTISAGARALKDRMLSQLPAERASAYKTLLAEGYRT